MDRSESAAPIVLFDYDGVIVDSLDLFVDAVNAAARRLGRRACFAARALRNLRQMSGQAIADIVQVEQDEYEQFLVYLDEYLLTRVEDMTLFPHIPEVIRDLSRHSVVGIVSATPSHVIRAVLSHFGLIGCFRHVAGGELRSTKAERIQDIVEIHQSDVSKAWMIGDTVSDVEQGKLAGCRTVAVTWGWHCVEWLREANPDCEVANAHELAACVTSGCG